MIKCFLRIIDWRIPIAVFPNNKTDCHDIIEILLKVALSTIPITLHLWKMPHSYFNKDMNCEIWVLFIPDPRIILSRLFFQTLSLDFFTYTPTVAKRITDRAEVTKITYWQRRLQINYYGEEIKTRART
jgi:hypothetical protein